MFSIAETGWIAKASTRWVSQVDPGNCHAVSVRSTSSEDIVQRHPKQKKKNQLAEKWIESLVPLLCSIRLALPEIVSDARWGKAQASCACRDTARTRAKIIRLMFLQQLECRNRNELYI